MELEEAYIRPVRRRLAVLVAALLCALLLVLGIAVYITAQRALLDAARQSVSDRAVGEVPHLLALERRSSFQRQPEHDESDEGEVGGVSIVYAEANLKLLAGSGGPNGQELLDPGSARRALQARRSLFTTVAGVKWPYLIYTLPVTSRGHVVGLVQTGISEGPYLQGLRALLGILALVGGIGLLAAVGITGLVVNRALGPVRAAMERQRDFVADAAHELRTPLTIIRTAAELALANGDPEEQGGALEQVLAQDSHLTRLVDDLSLLARTDSGSFHLEHGSVDMSALVRETTGDLAVLADDTGVRLEAVVPDGLTVMGDAIRLRQLLMILLDNALKHTPEGGRVGVLLARRGGKAELTVRDTGPGIAPEDLPHLFDRFYRSNRARTGGDGTGLGLAIGRWIAEAHGGAVDAESRPGEGATFTVTLPVASSQST